MTTLKQIVADITALREDVDALLHKPIWMDWVDVDISPELEQQPEEITWHPENLRSWINLVASECVTLERFAERFDIKIAKTLKANRGE